MTTHYLRQIAGRPADQWVHCGKRLGSVVTTRTLADVSCRVCLAYIAKGAAYGYGAEEAALELARTGRAG